jgi:hypothetical protein
MAFFGQEIRPFLSRKPGIQEPDPPGQWLDDRLLLGFLASG